MVVIAAALALLPDYIDAWLRICFAADQLFLVGCYR